MLLQLGAFRCALEQTGNQAARIRPLESLVSSWMFYVAPLIGLIQIGRPVRHLPPGRSRQPC